MKKEQVTMIWEPVNECYIDTFKKALDEHPEVSMRLKFQNGMWESKETFEVVNGRMSAYGEAFRNAVRNIGRGVGEYMSYMEDVKFYGYY